MLKPIHFEPRPRFFWPGWLLLLALGGLLGTGCQPEPRSTPAGPTGDSLDVRAMTFNIRYGTANDGPNRWEARREMVFDVFRKYDADFVGAQEAMVFQIDEIREALPQYHALGRTREAEATEGEAVPIFYRHDRWQPDTSGTFWFSDTPQEPASKGWGNDIPRITTWARFLERDTGRAVYVYNTHFDHMSQPSRERSAEALLAHLRAGARGAPVLLVGDFNAGETNPAVQTIKQEPVRFVDTFRAVHPEARDVGTFNSWNGTLGGEKIDYVFVQPGARVLAAGIIRDNREGRYPSDHYPVWADVRLPAAP